MNNYETYETAETMLKAIDEETNPNFRKRLNQILYTKKICLREDICNIAEIPWMPEEFKPQSKDSLPLPFFPHTSDDLLVWEWTDEKIIRIGEINREAEVTLMDIKRASMEVLSSDSVLICNRAFVKIKKHGTIGFPISGFFGDESYETMNHERKSLRLIPENPRVPLGGFKRIGHVPYEQSVLFLPDHKTRYLVEYYGQKTPVLYDCLSLAIFNAFTDGEECRISLLTTGFGHLFRRTLFQLLKTGHVFYSATESILKKEDGPSYVEEMLKVKTAGKRVVKNPLNPSPYPKSIFDKSSDTEKKYMLTAMQQKILADWTSLLKKKGFAGTSESGESERLPVRLFAAENLLWNLQAETDTDWGFYLTRQNLPDMDDQKMEHLLDEFIFQELTAEHFLPLIWQKETEKYETFFPF